MLYALYGCVLPVQMKVINHLVYAMVVHCVMPDCLKTDFAIPFTSAWPCKQNS